jgi:DNA primase
VILVEGLFDLAALWQSGFRNTTAALGIHLAPAQFHELCDGPDRRVYIAFDQDDNQAGQRAAQALAQRLEEVGVAASILHLPGGHDPNSYFLSGATARDFAACLRGAPRL